MTSWRTDMTGINVRSNINGVHPMKRTIGTMNGHQILIQQVLLAATLLLCRRRILYHTCALLMLMVFMTAKAVAVSKFALLIACLLYTSPSPRDRQKDRMPSS